MTSTLEEKIDKISEETSYMRGQWDATIPEIRKLLSEHGKRIGAQEQSMSNMTGKSTAVGAVSGGMLAALLTWIFKHF